MDTGNIMLSVITLIILLIASKYILPIIPEAKKANSTSLNISVSIH